MTFTTDGLRTLATSMLDMPMWVGLITDDGEPKDGYSRARVSAWQVENNRAEAEVAFVAGRGWGRLAGFLVAGAPIGQEIFVQPLAEVVMPRPGDTITVRPWLEIDG